MRYPVMTEMHLAERWQITPTRHHPEHPGRAAAPVHEPAVVPAESAADRLGCAAGGGGRIRFVTETAGECQDFCV